MFLLVYVRHVGAHPGGHQHGVSIEISINLGKTFLRISRKLSEIFLWPESWRGSLHIYLLSFPRFWTLSIERFWIFFYVFWMAWHWKPTTEPASEYKGLYGGKTITLLISKTLLTSSLLYALSFFFNGWSSTNLDYHGQEKREREEEKETCTDRIH